jgi:hypothetical protein
MTENEKKIVEELESTMQVRDPRFTKLRITDGVAMFFIRKIASLQDQIDKLKKEKR